jgi:hypothetical protein
MTRIMEINPKWNGGMLKTTRGLQPFYKKVKQSVGGGVVLPPLINDVSAISIEDKKVVGGKVKQSYGVKPLKFLM